MKQRGNRSSNAQVEARRESVLQELKTNRNQNAIAVQLGVHRNTICRDLKALAQRLATSNLAEHEARVAAQEGVLELIEQSLIEEQVSPEVANTWRAIRSDIAKLRGLNAENRSVIAHVSTNHDLPFLRFKKATANLTEAQFEDVLTYATALPREPRTVVRDASWFPEPEHKLLEEKSDEQPA